MKKIWNFGIQAGDNEQFIEDVRLTNIFAVIGIFFALFKGFTLYALGLERPFFVISIASIAFLLVYVSNYFRKIQLSKFLVWLIPHFIVFIISSSVGMKGQCHTLLVHLIVVGNVLNYQFTWLRHFLMIFTTIFFGFVLYITNFSLFLFPNISADTYYYIALNTFITHLIGGSSIVLIVVKRIKDKYEEAEKAQQGLSLKYEELIKVNQELDRFVYSVSHDLRSPIASSLGLVDIASKETEMEKMRYYLGLQKITLNKLDGFIKDILAYSQNARMNITLEKVDFNDLITDMLPILLPTDQDSPVILSLNIHQEHEIYSDKTRLQFILKNLIANAINYRKRNSQEAFVKVSLTNQNEGVKIIIEDNGIGIEEMHLPHIFKMFYRGTNLTNGSGLGLYIVNEMLDKLQGNISVQSVLNKGTTFMLFIPNLQSEAKRSTVDKEE